MRWVVLKVNVESVFQTHSVFAQCKHYRETATLISRHGHMGTFLEIIGCVFVKCGARGHVIFWLQQQQQHHVT